MAKTPKKKVLGTHFYKTFEGVKYQFKGENKEEVTKLWLENQNKKTTKSRKDAITKTIKEMSVKEAKSQNKK